MAISPRGLGTMRRAKGSPLCHDGRSRATPPLNRIRQQYQQFAATILSFLQAP